MFVAEYIHWEIHIQCVACNTQIVMNILHVELSQVTGASASAVSELLTITINYKAHIFFFVWWGWGGGGI